MKKILLTTTALTLLAGAAAAEISLSGSGRLGIINSGGTTNTTHRFRVNFNASGETDGGLTFGAYVRANMNGNSIGSGSGLLGVIGAPRVWIGNGTATLTIGNASGAVAQNGNIWGCSVGFTGSCVDMASNQWSWASHSSGGVGNNVVRVDFALGSANVSVSGGNTNDTEVAASFALGAAKVGISYDNGAALTGGTQVGVSFDAGSANIGVHLARTNSGLTGGTATVSYGIGGGTLYAFGGKQIAGGTTRRVYGVAYSQSLGGGATVAVSARSVGGTTTTDAGVKFKF